ncbi:MAG: carboxypeptidase-like regulatory domain-containing protein, partial [Bacteroidota bacterium]
MLKRLYSLIAVLCIVSTGIMAQNATIKGRVRDEKTREPLPFATVMTDDRKHGVQTDQEGQFKLVLPAGKHVLLFNYISYKTESRLIELSPGESVGLDILLAPELLDFRQIVITGNRNRQRIEETVTSMDVLPQQLLERRADNNIETAVEQVPGVTVIDGQANI